MGTGTRNCSVCRYLAGSADPSMIGQELRDRILRNASHAAVARIEQPSTKARTTAHRFSLLSLFMLTIMLDRTGIPS